MAGAPVLPPLSPAVAPPLDRETAAAWLSQLLTAPQHAGDASIAPGLVEWSRTERVHLLLADRLGVTGPGRSALPADVAAPLVAAARMAAADDVARTREAARVVQRLEDRGCCPIVFKGAALAHTHYARPWLRPRLDTDILVSADHRVEAAAVFADLGYRRPTFVSGRLVMYQEMHVRTETGGLEHVFDLHWRVANPQVLAGVLSHAELAGRSRWVDLPVGRMRVPCPVDALLLACVHRAAHHRDSPDLLWLHDIHLLAERFSADEWREALDLARTRGVTAICARGLTLAATRFGTAVPASVAEAWAGSLGTDAVRSGGGATEPSAVFLRRDLRPMARLGSDLRALGLVDRARLLMELALPPRSYMRSAHGESAWLPWWYLRRLVGGVTKWMRRVPPEA